PDHRADPRDARGVPAAHGVGASRFRGGAHEAAPRMAGARRRAGRAAAPRRRARHARERAVERDAAEDADRRHGRRRRAGAVARRTADRARSARPARAARDRRRPARGGPRDPREHASAGERGVDVRPDARARPRPARRERHDRRAARAPRRRLAGRRVPRSHRLVNALATLTYSDRRAFANGVRALLRKPARAIAWAGWLLAIVAFGWLRLGTARHSGARHTAGVGLLGPDFWVGGMVALFAIVLATGAHRFVGVFSSRAEAQFFTGARLPPLVVVGYLQLRAVATMLAQSVTRFAYIVVVGVPAGGTVRGFAFEALFFASIAAATASVALPRAILRGAPMRLAQAAGVALAIAMLIPL